MTAAPTPSPPMSPTCRDSGGASRSAGLMKSALSILDRKSNRPVAAPTGWPAPQSKPVAHASRLVALVAPLVAFGLGSRILAAGPAPPTTVLLSPRRVQIHVTRGARPAR